MASPLRAILNENCKAGGAEKFPKEKMWEFQSIEATRAGWAVPLGSDWDLPRLGLISSRK